MATSRHRVTRGSRLVEKPQCPWGRLLGGPGGEGRAEWHRQHCQALFSPIVLHFLPACALRWCPHGCPHGNSRVTAAISHLSSCPHAGLPARGSPGPPPVCLSFCHRHLSLHYNSSSSHHLSLHTLLGATVVPGAVRCSPPWRTPCLVPPFPDGGDVRCHTEKMCPGAVKINGRIFCKIPSKCNKVY